MNREAPEYFSFADEQMEVECVGIENELPFQKQVFPEEFLVESTPRTYARHNLIPGMVTTADLIGIRIRYAKGSQGNRMPCPRHRRPLRRTNETGENPEYG